MIVSLQIDAKGEIVRSGSVLGPLGSLASPSFFSDMGLSIHLIDQRVFITNQKIITKLFFSLNMLVRAVLLDKKPDEVPMLVESVLSRVIEEFENRITSQVELDFHVVFDQESRLILKLRDMMIGLIHEGFQRFFRQLNDKLRLKQEGVAL
uniref:Uncharacterized protein n=1 Tax=Lactuca sativa TaxID=4236 RepID=A0A9R1WV02_LACSA|nr:hypothetical protein LSAT_V11C900487570 [Lactuca sativa]